VGKRARCGFSTRRCPQALRQFSGKRRRRGYYGAKIQDDKAILYKAVREDFRSAHNFLYEPGTSPGCADWDGGKSECGGGLHFCADPLTAKRFDSEATRFVACPVLLSEIVVHENANLSSKNKGSEGRWADI